MKEGEAATYRKRVQPFQSELQHIQPLFQHFLIVTPLPPLYPGPGIFLGHVSPLRLGPRGAVLHVVLELTPGLLDVVLELSLHVFPGCRFDNERVFDQLLLQQRLKFPGLLRHANDLPDDFVRRVLVVCVLHNHSTFGHHITPEIVSAAVEPLFRVIFIFYLLPHCGGNDDVLVGIIAENILQEARTFPLGAANPVRGDRLEKDEAIKLFPFHVSLFGHPRSKLFEDLHIGTSVIIKTGGVY